MSETRFRRSDNFIFRKVVNEMILVPVKQDVAQMEFIFTLNEVGVFVWDRLSKSSTLTELRQAMVDEFDVDPALAEEDLNLFLNELESLQALERSE